MKHMKTFIQLAVLLLTGLLIGTPAYGQTNSDDEDIWRQVSLNEVDFQKSKNYCLRIYGYYRYVDDGIAYFADHEYKLYRVYEGICELDVRYDKDEDEGAEIVVGRDLVHPEEPGKFMDFYELKPYTFLEKARRLPKKYTMETAGDTTRVYAKTGLAGIAVRDVAHQELRMDYNAIAPDTILTVNIIIASARLKNVHANAVYQLEDEVVEYVPQGNLKRIIFDGDCDMKVLGSKEVFHENTELYVDSVVYMTKDEYKASKRQPKKRRLEATGYTLQDIDRLKQKLGVPPLSNAVLEKIEEQRDWDDQYEQWKLTDKTMKSINKKNEYK